MSEMKAELHWSGLGHFDRNTLQLFKRVPSTSAAVQFLEIGRHEIPQLLVAIKEVFGEEALADNPTVVSE